MEPVEVVWTKVGKMEHNLPAGKHVIYNDTYDTAKITEKDLINLEKKGCKHVRKAEPKAKAEKE